MTVTVPSSRLGLYKGGTTYRIFLSEDVYLWWDSYPYTTIVKPRTFVHSLSKEPLFLSVGLFYESLPL